VCNEIPFRQEAFDWSDHIAQYVHDCEAGMPKQHPVGITAEGGAPFAGMSVAYLKRSSSQ